MWNRGIKQPLSKRPQIGFQNQLSLNAGQKYSRMEHSAILPIFIKLPFIIRIFVLSIFEWPFYTGFTVHVLACDPLATEMNLQNCEVRPAFHIVYGTGINNKSHCRVSQ